MPESSAVLAARARKIEQVLLRALAKVGQAHAADCIDVDESTISRWKDKRPDGKPGEIARMAMFLAALGLKATPQEYRCYDEKTLDAMLTLARQRMDQIESVEHLQHEGGEA